MFDELLDNLVAFILIAIVFETEVGHWRDLDWILVFIVLAVTKPGPQIVPSTDLDNLGICLRSLLQEALLRLLVLNVCCHYNHKNGLFLYALNHIKVILDNSIGLLLRSDKLANRLNRLINRYIINLFL